MTERDFKMGVEELDGLIRGVRRGLFNMVLALAAVMASGLVGLFTGYMIWGGK